MKEIQKNIAIFLSVLMLMCSLPISNVLALESQANFYSSNASTFDEATPDESIPGEISGKCGDNAHWSFDPITGTLTIYGSGDMNSYSFGNYSPWYSYRDLIKTVVISDSVTSIGDYAFFSCYSLTEITIPDSVTSIGYCTFLWCDSLTTVTIGNSVTSIGYESFANCTSLTEITIPDSVTSIVDCAFYGCTSLASITIPDSVTSIGYEAFARCTSLTEITIPDSVTTIDEWAFFDCDNLTLCVYEYSYAHQYAINNNIPFVLIGATECDREGHKTSTVDEVAPDCENDGTKEHQICSICGNVLINGATASPDEVIIPALGHNTSTVDEVAPDCENDGTKEHQKCNTC
ncbi:MAG: leucine-rich repeat domain-containing protein, partial [Clostridia bacterium]|nr:leucine-rich repeat domain-containing protein [Clostridia bacterium]